ncbi:MAG TPA: FAD-dependent monooxygenase [Candidatus Binatia bacterium]|nr:FAD-dependent monooxygenase [Candidatus Binatia bacterium]
MREVDVLIVGGGPVGLTASILLSGFGVSSLLVERHPSTSIHPKARGINARTMEIFRQCGVEDAVRAAGLPPERARFIVWARSLAGEELERRVPWRAREEAAQITPVRNCICAQDDLEPVLRRRAESLGPGALAFDTELAGFEQDAEGVTAILRERAGDARVRARYLIAADGARSRVREALGVALHGTPALYRSINILLNADLTPWTAHRPAALYFIEQPGLKATFLTINGVNRWGFLINNLPPDGDADDYTPERCAAVVRQAAGVPDLAVEILGAVPWVAAALVAERYRRGRVFLAGDAAHHMPPTGGFGLNTGVQDVHNLAWKLAAVRHGRAGAALLDTYEDERLPYGRAITEQSLINARSLGRGGPEQNTAPALALGRPEYLNELGMIFGAAYESSAVVSDGTPPPKVENPITDYRPGARPGHRAAHVWLERGGVRLSTLDLLGGRFVLLAGAAGHAWCGAARAAARAHGVALEAFRVGGGGELDDPDGGWQTLWEIDREGAVLVRPDGQVAWRSRGAAPDAEGQLRRVLGRVLSLD